jgi:hypothetical protein
LDLSKVHAGEKKRLSLELDVPDRETLLKSAKYLRIKGISEPVLDAESVSICYQCEHYMMGCSASIHPQGILSCYDFRKSRLQKLRESRRREAEDVKRAADMGQYSWFDLGVDWSDYDEMIRNGGGG